MRLGVLTRERDHLSLRLIREQITEYLLQAGVEIIPFSLSDRLPTDCDLIWEPGLGMRRVPSLFKGNALPLVATMSGLRAFSLPAREAAVGKRGWLREKFNKARIAYGWRWLRHQVSAVTTGSEFGADEIARVLGVSRDIVFPIYYGIDHGVFCEDGPRYQAERPYFFVVSIYNQPRKNVQRILAAYTQLPEKTRPDLVMKFTHYRGAQSDIPGVKIISQNFTLAELAAWYRGALGFVFPSLYENFGFPIIEAMACGCPVITANVTACPEVAGDAALLVNPRSVDAIRGAMARLMRDERLRRDLHQKGLARAAQFTWARSGRAYLDLFEHVLAKERM